MAWTAPSTWVSGAILTAAQLNEQLRDNLLANGPGRVKATRSAALALADSSFIAVNFDAQSFDTETMFTPTQNIITIKTAGLYQIHGHFSFDANAVGQRYVGIVRNATFSGSGDTATITAGTRLVAQTAAVTVVTQSVQSCSTLFELAVDDTLTLGVFQNSGAPIAMSGVEGASLSAAWIGTP
jgi:hypothetical protein